MCLRCLESDCEDLRLDGGQVQEMYAGTLDAVVLHGALPAEMAAAAAASIAAQDIDASWNRPNKPFPQIDLRLLGMGAAPCATMPMGPDQQEYLQAAVETPRAVRRLFPAEFDPIACLEDRFRQLSGLPAEVPVAPGEHPFSPCTVRVIQQGAGLMVHHDNRYGLPVYDDVRALIDTGLFLSYFVVLQRPTAGGRLCVYGKGPAEDTALPMLANGQPDPVGFAREVDHQFFDLAPGDLIVFASGRLYHTVETVGDGLARITLGGFLGLDANHRRCLYWS